MCSNTKGNNTKKKKALTYKKSTDDKIKMINKNVFLLSENLLADNKKTPIAKIVKLSFKMEEFQNKEEGSKNKPIKNHSSLYLKIELNNLNKHNKPIVDKKEMNTVFI